MIKTEILEKIKISLSNPAKGQNSMGCNESFYDAYFMIGKCFTEEELKSKDKGELEDLIKLANFALVPYY